MLSFSEELNKDYNELIFEKRNKEYGAYVMRNEYPKTVLKSMALVGVLVLTASFASLLRKVDAPIEDAFKLENKVDSVRVREMDLTKEFENKQKKADAPKQSEPAKSNNQPTVENPMVQVTDSTDIKTDSTKHENAIDPNAVVSNNPTGGPSDPFPKGPGGGGKELGGAGGNSDPVNVGQLEEMPEFPGGENALFRFLSETSIYPADMREMGMSGTVHLSFVLSAEGYVESVDVLKSPNESFSREAKRVMGKMPQWKPGKMGNKGVRVRYNLPFKFKFQ